MEITIMMIIFFSIQRIWNYAHPTYFNTFSFGVGPLTYDQQATQTLTKNAERLIKMRPVTKVLWLATVVRDPFSALTI